MQEVELKPCPFCGGKAVVKATTKRIGFTIWCECEKCYAKTEGYCPNIEKEDASLANIEECKNKAIKLWNRRCDMQEVFEKIIEKLEELKKAEIERDDSCDEEGYGDGEEIYEDGKSAGRYEQTVRIIKIVKQEAEKFGTDTNVGSNGWIPCGSGVMPRANGWYLVTNHLGVVQEQRWSANHWEKLRDDSVLAWRELPYPYQPKGE